jgi:beta-glucanase (GH16 family)
VKSPSPSLAVAAALLLNLQACGGGGGGSAPAPAPSPAPAPAPAPAPSPTPSNTWTLVWEDSFDGPAGTAPNPQNWTDALGNAEASGWGNRELQSYTAAPKNAALNGNGELEIRALKSSDASLPCWDGKPCAYTSARLISQGKRSFTYGKLEARILIPGGQGIWPAFWALGEGAWPNAGEIDVMEFIGKTPSLIYGTAHGPGYSGAQGIGKSTSPAASVPGSYHTYTVIKRANEIIWQVDGQEFHRLTPASLPSGATWVFERPYYLLLNLAVGGDWPGSPDANTVFPAVMKVDWVRIYSEN